MKHVSAADANRHFSRLLRDVRGGETVVVMSRGKPVATMAPVASDGCESDRRQQAWEEFISHLRTRPALNIPITWTRDELYDDD